MRFSTIDSYIESVETLSKRTRTKCDLVALRDSEGSLQYKVSRGVVCFEMKGNRGLYMFLNARSLEKYMVRNRGANLQVGWLYVSVGERDGFWMDVVLGVSCKEFFKVSDGVLQRVLVEGFRAVERGAKWGFENENGAVVVDCVWDEVDDFGEGRALVRRGDLWGLIDNNGSVVADPIYDELSWDGSNYACGEVLGKWGILNRGGDVVVKFEWDWVSEFSYGYATVERGDKYGFVDATGNLVVDVKYDQVVSFNGYGVASVKVGDKEFFIDTKDRRV